MTPSQQRRPFMYNAEPHSAIRDARVTAVIERLQATRRAPVRGNPMQSGSRDPHDYAERGFSIHPEQGELIYLLCRGLRAQRVAEFATSVGMSTLYFAAAMRDNGGGTVIGSEIVPAKVAAAKRNLAEAGLADYADIREGDARKTLRDRRLAGRQGADAGAPGGRDRRAAASRRRLRHERQCRGGFPGVRARSRQRLRVDHASAQGWHRALPEGGVAGFSPAGVIVSRNRTMPCWILPALLALFEENQERSAACPKSRPFIRLIARSGAR
ncbi:class I SAM-dependent methyltransferase [Bradyrhizobium brasilense]|nr:class I SAM-dependent methyltransferase [Bradyrhizobium brasilense]